MKSKITKRLKLQLLSDLVNLLKNKKIRIYSLITLHAFNGLSLEDFHNMFSKFLKEFDFHIYFYSFEISKSGHLHLHLLSSFCFKNNFLLLKDTWFSILSNKCGQNAAFSQSQSMHYSVVSESSWEKTIFYLLKCEDLNYVASDDGISKFGGHSAVISIFAKYQDLSLLCFPKKYKSSSSSSSYISSDFSSSTPILFKGIDSVFYDFESLLSKVIQDYDNSQIPEVLVREQLVAELISYSENLDYFDFSNFVVFLNKKSHSIGRFYMDLHYLFKSICHFNDNFIIHNFVSYGFNLLVYINKTSLFYKKFIIAFIHKFIPNSELASLDDGRVNAIVFLLTNTLYKIFRAENSSLMMLFQNIARFMLAYLTDSERRQNLLSDLPDLTTADLCHLGHYLYTWVKLSFFHDNQKFIKLFEINSNFDDGQESSGFVDWEDGYLSPEGSVALTSISKTKNVHLEFEIDTITKLIPRFNKKALHQIQINTTVKKPLLIPPKSWKFTKTGLISEQNVEFCDAGTNFTGGLLINNILLKRPLCKKLPFVGHELLVDNDSINVLNRIQTISYCIDPDLLDFYKSNKKRLPGVLGLQDLKQKRLNYSLICRRLSDLYLQKKELINKPSSDVTLINQSISQVRFTKQLLQAEIVKHHLMLRLLSLFSLVKVDKFYFAQEFDFRMRIYPVPHELSHVAHKFSRSLLRFCSKCAFNESSFKLYSVSQFTDTRDMNELQILTIFETDVRFLLENYKLSECISTINMKAKEPYLFYSCAVEWCRYTRHQGNYFNSEGYLSNFPIYYDCTAQGPQIMSVFFALKTFSTYLNLCKQDKSEKRGDYYSAVISQFLQSLKSANCSYLIDNTVDFDSSLINWFRKHLKQSIMTLIYGVSMRKFLDAVADMCMASDAKDYLNRIFKVGDMEKFKLAFARDFWSFTHKLPIFQMKPLLESYYNNLGAVGVLEWSVFDTNIIRPKYLQTRSHRLKSRVIKDKYQFVMYEALDKVLKRKQMSSLLANFTHSLDSWILRQLFSKCQFDIMSIHDSFGVHGCNEADLRHHLRGVLEYLLEHGFDFFTSQWASTLEKSIGLEAKKRFMSVVSDVQKYRETLSKEDLRGAHHFISL